MSNAEVVKDLKANGDGKGKGRIPLGTTPYADETTERLAIEGMGTLVTERKTGKRWFEKEDGTRIETESLPTQAAPAEPEKPKPVKGTMVFADGKWSFVPDDKEQSPIDLSAAIKERDEEAKLSPLAKAMRALQKQQQADNDRLQALATDGEKVAALSEERARMQQQMQSLVNDLQQKDIAVAAMADVLAKLRVGAR